MGNIISYLRWRGDLTFENFPFNNIDNLILTQLAYVDLRGIVPGMNEADSFTIEEAAALHQSKKQANKDEIVLFPSIENLLEEMAITARFSNAKLSHYVDVVDHDQEMTQFSALQVQLSDETVYIAFRGTDNTIVGWREDFSISYQVVPAQRRAVSYINQIICRGGTRYRIGGHSKGGNLAVYASMCCDDEIKQQILEVYNNDGPGLCPSIIKEEDYQKIKDKIHNIVPEFSVIGQLFYHENSCLIVKSSGNGLLQHNAMTWEVEGDRFLEVEELSPECRIYNQVFDRWIEDVDMEQRERFTADFFDTLSANGARTIMDVVGGGINGFETILFAMEGSDKRAKIVVWKFIKSFFQGIVKIDFRELLKSRKLLKGFGLFFAGTCLLAFPGFAMQIMGTIFFLWLLFYSTAKLFRLYRNHKRHESVATPKVIFYGTVAVIELFCIVKNSIIIISTNLIMGFFFGWRCWNQVNAAVQQKVSGEKKWIFPMLDAILTCSLGIITVAAFDNILVEHILVAGTYFTIWGMVEVVNALYFNAKREYV